MRWLGNNYRQPLVNLEKTKEISKGEVRTDEIYQILFIQDDNIATWNYNTEQARDEVFRIIENTLTPNKV